ncbi:MAG: phosphoesterase [Rhodospirillales bacterium]|nr:phosphoesterase [Acetobacter sp.]
MKRPIFSSFNKSLLACACASGLMLSTTQAQRIAAGQQATAVAGQPVKTVFYILMENRNFTAGTDTTGGSVLVGNPAAPYINSLITPGNANAAQVSWCSAYHHVLSTASGANPSIHPSEPNYIWMEAGSNLSKADDNDPYGSNSSVKQIETYLANNPGVSGQHLSGLLQAANISWKSYQEGIDHLNSAGNNINTGGSGMTNTLAPQSAWTVPLQSFSGTSANYTNPYNGSHQYNFACKHNGSLYFLDTNGSSLGAANLSPSNLVTYNYAPLEQLATDLANNAVARYNVITPDQYNDMHTALSNGFAYKGTTYTGDKAQVAQGDNFLSILVPQIMASQAYQDNGAIVIWTDETEGTNQNDFNHTLMEIVISPLAKGNAYNSTVNLTHSSDVATMQQIFQVTANTATGYLNDAANSSNSAGALAGSATGFGTGVAQDMSDLFVAGAIPSGLPSTRVTAGGYTVNRRNNTATQTVTVTNSLTTPISNPIYLVVSNLNTTLINRTGTTQNTAPVGSQYVFVASGLAAGASANVVLQFTLPANNAGIVDTLSSVSSSGQP